MKSGRGGLMIAAGLLAASAGWANNIRVENVKVSVKPEAEKPWAEVQLDLRWDDSWRGGSNRWDAAWVFVKFRAAATSAWQHAVLSSNSAEHTPAADSVIAAVPDGMGVFVYHAADFTGNVNYVGAKLRWNGGAQLAGLPAGAAPEVSVQAIEMVYIPAGAFHLGSGGGEGGHFEQFQEGAKANPPFLVTSEAALTVGNAAGNLYYQTNGCRPQHVGDQQGLLADAFPKGYAAFYCMKYELSQGQYAAFLNTLTSSQAANRFPNQAGNSRHTLSRTPANVYTSPTPERACNYLSWADLAAYAAWAGLRPMTELEYEKACRGFGAPVRHEFAWGSTNIVQITGEAGKPGSGKETAWPTNANACFGSHWSLQGPVRGGIFAVSNAPRQRAGAGYFGVLELSGNVSERCVTVGNPSGRAFQGTLGQGMLNANGNATNADWPGYDKDGVVGFEGAGLRGGGWQIGAAALPVSCRNRAVFPYAGRAEAQGYGGRAVRQAP